MPSKFSALKRLARLKSFKMVTGAKEAKKKHDLALKLGAGAAIGGAVAGQTHGPPGHRGDSAREGALVGAGTVLATAGATRYIFRRIRGRIIPIKVKK